MPKFQISQEASKDYSITIYVDQPSDPALNIPLIIKDIAEIKGNNSRDIPFFHLQTEVQIQIIDVGNQLSGYLQNIDESDIYVDVDFEESPLLRGNLRIEDDKYPVNDLSAKLTMTAHDGLIRAKTTFYDISKHHLLTQLSFLIKSVFDNIDDLPVYTGLTLFHDGTAGTSYERIDNMRARVSGFLYDLDRISHYELLNRICHDFNLTVHQEAGAWYVLDNFQKRIGYNTLYQIKPEPSSTINVEFDKTISGEILRKKGSTQPTYMPRDIFKSVKSKIEIPRDNESILNPELISWHENDLFPLNWEFADPGRYERPIMIQENIRAVNQGMLVRQFIPIANKPYTEVKLTLKGSLTFSDDQTSGLYSVRVARIRAFSESKEYGFGYDDENNDFLETSDGWITITQSYPASQQKVDINIEQTIEVLPKLNYLIELYYDVVSNSAGGLDVLPGFYLADINVNSPIENPIEEYSTGEVEEQLEHDMFINERRQDYGRSDLEYYDGTAWQECNGEWSNSTRIESITDRINTRFGGKRYYFDLFTKKGSQYNLTDRVDYLFRGTTYKCIPLRIKRHSNQSQLNVIRLLSLS